MGTVSNSLASSSSNPASSPVKVSGSNSSLFTGTSQYSSDFQNVISRAVAIADLPINLLQSQQSALSSQQDELGTFETLVGKLQSAVRGIETSLGGSSFQTIIQADSTSATATTDGSAVSATIGKGAVEGVYAVKVLSTGSYATSLSKQSWNSTPSPLGVPQYTVVAGGKRYSITPNDNSASSMAAAINAKCNGVVNATVVKISATDTRISLQSATLDPTTLDIQAPGFQQQQVATGNLATSLTANTWDSGAPVAAYDVLAGGNRYSITPISNDFQDVINAINGVSGHPVTATQVDLDPLGAHDYRIQLQSSLAGPLDIQPATPVSLQKSTQTGQKAEYQVGNSGVTAYSSSRDITISNGVTVSVKGTTTKAVNITVARSSSTVSSALSAFADAYNAVVDEVAKQRGQSAGPLQGTSILTSISQSLRNIATYTDGSGGAVNSLAASNGGLGLDLGSDGHLTFSQLVFMGTDLGSSGAVTAFFGSSTAGGFLKSATDILNSLEDSKNTTGGLIRTTKTSLTSQISRVGTQISKKQDQVVAMQLQMQNQMAQADALIAAMEQKFTYISSMFEAQNIASKSYSG